MSRLSFRRANVAINRDPTAGGQERWLLYGHPDFSHFKRGGVSYVRGPVRSSVNNDITETRNASGKTPVTRRQAADDVREHLAVNRLTLGIGTSRLNGQAVPLVPFPKILTLPDETVRVAVVQRPPECAEAPPVFLDTD